MSKIRKLKKPVNVAHQGQHAVEQVAKEPKKLRKEQIGSIFVGAIMILSVMGYMWMNPTDIVKYGKYKFSQRDDGWYNKDFKMTFNYHPVEVDNINLSNNLVRALSDSAAFYVTYPQNDSYRQQIAASLFALAQFMESRGVYVIPGFTGAVEENVVDNTQNADQTAYKISQITCANASASIPVFMFREGENSSIVENSSNCYVFEAAESYDFYRFKDRMIYSILEVIAN